MNKTFLEAVRIIFTVIVIILSFITIIMIIMKLLGYSTTETTIIFSVIGILVALQTIIIKVLFQIKEDVGNLKEFKRQTIEKVKEIEKKIKK